MQFGPEKLKTPYAKPIKPITPVNNSDGSPEFKWVDEDVSIYPYFKDNELFDLDTDEQDGKPAVTILANQNNNNFQKFIAKSGEDQRVAERDKNKAMLLIMTNAMSVYHHNKETKEQEKLLNYKKISEPLSQSLLYVFEIDKDVA